MFIKRQKRNRSDDQAPRFVFYLVEAVRREGKPRQRTVAYLGSLSERPTGTQRASSLDCTKTRIRDREELDEEERHTLLDSLEEKTLPVAKVSPQALSRQNTSPPRGPASKVGLTAAEEPPPCDITPDPLNPPHGVS